MFSERLKKASHTVNEILPLGSNRNTAHLIGMGVALGAGLADIATVVGARNLDTSFFELPTLAYNLADLPGLMWYRAFLASPIIVGELLRAGREPGAFRIQSTRINNLWGIATCGIKVAHLSYLSNPEFFSSIRLPF